MQEVSIIVVGVLVNTVIFFLMALTNYLSLKMCRKFPHILSKIFVWYGIATIFDFLLVAIIDCAK